MSEILERYWQAYLGFGIPITGLAMTIWILLLAVLFGTVLAIPMAIWRCSSNRWVSTPVRIYTFVFRGTPLYVQLLLVYTGLFSLSVVRGTPLLATFFRDGFNCVILAFTINTCAYMTEVLAGAIRAIPHGEVEAAQAFGFSRFRLYTKIILPSAFRRALPFYSNEVILVLHSTSLAFTATVPELLKVARDVNSATFNSLPAFGIAAILYAALAMVLVALFRKAEKKWLGFLKPAAH